MAGPMRACNCEKFHKHDRALKVGAVLTTKNSDSACSLGDVGLAIL